MSTNPGECGRFEKSPHRFLFGLLLPPLFFPHREAMRETERKGIKASRRRLRCAWLHGGRSGGAATTAASSAPSQLSSPGGGMAAAPTTHQERRRPSTTTSLSKATPPAPPPVASGSTSSIVACGLPTSELVPQDFRLHEGCAMVASVPTSPRSPSPRRPSARRRYHQHAAPTRYSGLLVQAMDTKYQSRMKRGVMGELARTAQVFSIQSRSVLCLWVKVCDLDH